MNKMEQDHLKIAPLSLSQSTGKCIISIPDGRRRRWFSHRFAVPSLPFPPVNPVEKKAVCRRGLNHDSTGVQAHADDPFYPIREEPRGVKSPEEISVTELAFPLSRSARSTRPRGSQYPGQGESGGVSSLILSFHLVPASSLEISCAINSR